MVFYSTVFPLTSSIWEAVLVLIGGHAGISDVFRCINVANLVKTPEMGRIYEFTGKNVLNFCFHETTRCKNHLCPFCNTDSLCRIGNFDAGYN